MRNAPVVQLMRDRGKGKEAMASSHRANSRISHLWQLPLLLLSLGLFGYATYLLIDPQPGPTLDDKIGLARNYTKSERPEAAIEKLNELLALERLEREQESRIRMHLAEALEAGQKLRRLNIAANHTQIIEQSRIAMAQGYKPDADVHRRLGESYDALGRATEALENFRIAMALDPERGLPLQRRVIDLQLSRGDIGPADASIDQYLQSTQITDSERAWAIGEKAQILVDQGKFSEAKSLLAECLRLDDDQVTQGVVNYRLGYVAWKLGDTADAERLLRVARDLLKVQHPHDADAAYLLGRIHQDRGDLAAASSFYVDVLTSHPDSRVAPLARLGRGVCRISVGDDDAGLTDLHDLINEVQAKPALAQYKKDVVASLCQAAAVLAGKGNYQGSLEVLAYEQTLVPEPPADFYARLASVYERRADQLEKSLASTATTDRIRRTQQIRDYRTRAGDASVAYSRALTLVDDKGYGEALWHGIELYDRATNLQAVISALDLFVAERPDDALAPDALLRLGRAYQAAGMFDKAIAAFQRNQFRYPQSLAASKSAVPLAQAYIAKGPDSFKKAETVLLSVVDNNPLLTPEAGEFKQALFELAQLFYRTGRYEESVARLEELTQRYPDDARMSQLLFLMGDSYRKSSTLLDVKVTLASNAGANGAVESLEAQQAKRERLSKARDLYDRVIELNRTTAPTTDIDKLYLKLSHFYKADCLYDLGAYEDAIRAYDAAAFRYQDDPSSLAAYVQIVNAYYALGRSDEAKTANERAKWLLTRMPEDAFRNETFAMPKSYWEQWLKWTSVAGMW